MRSTNEHVGTVIVMMLAAAFAIAGCMRNGKKDSERRHDGGRIETAAAEMQYMPDSPDFCGVYRGTIPAADCPGICVTMEVGSDGTFRMVWDYIDRDGLFESEGRYVVAGNRLIAVGDGSDSTIFRMEGDRLRLLDGRGEVITGPLEDMFLLKKVEENSE